jgi:hypothetical protein
MTDISDDEARQVLWASSDEGKEQLRAAWAQAQRLGLHSHGAVMADVLALLWAAREAWPPDEPRRSQASGPGPARLKFRELLSGHIADSSVYTTGILRAELERAGFDVPRETVFRWVSEDRAGILAGLVTG